MNDNHFEDSKRQNEISLDEECIHLTNLALMDHKRKEPEDICSQSRTSDTDSSDRGSTAIHCSLLNFILQKKNQVIQNRLLINLKPIRSLTFVQHF